MDGRITVFGSLSNREIYPSPLYARIISQQHGIIRELGKCLQFVAIIVCFDNCNSSWSGDGFMDY